MAKTDTADPDNPRYFAAYWLVPTDGSPARKLTTQEAFATEYTNEGTAWSTDGQYLLVRNKVFDLEGNQLSLDFGGAVSWLPNSTYLLVNGAEGLRIVTVTGEEIAHIADANFPAIVAWSHDGLRLAYSPGRSEIGSDAEIVVYALGSGENQVVGVIPQVVTVELLRWSGDDSQVIAGLSRSRSDEIWAVDAQAGSTPQLVLGNALLIEVVPYPLD